MAINVRQWPSTRLESYPDFGSVGCVCLTYDGTATAAQVAGDDSLFSSWTLLAANAVGRSGPVTVYLESDLVVTGTVALNNFPLGSSIVGSGGQRTLTLSGSTGLQGIFLFDHLLIDGDVTGVPPLGYSGIHFTFCEFAHSGGVIWGTGANGSSVSFHRCSDQDEFAVLGETQEVVSITGSLSDNYMITASGGTVFGSNFLVANDVAYSIFLSFDQSAGSSGLQTQAAGASLSLNFGTSALSSPNMDQAMNLATGDRVWPPAPSERQQLSLQMLFVSTDGSGAVNLNMGTTTAFIQGQIVRVTNIGNNADVITLRTAAGSNIRNGAVTGAATVGAVNALTMVFHNNAMGPGTPGWEVFATVENA